MKKKTTKNSILKILKWKENNPKINPENKNGISQKRTIQKTWSMVVWRPDACKKQSLYICLLHEKW